MGRGQRAAIVALVLTVSLVAMGSKASAQIAHPQCVPTAGSQIWCQGQYVGAELQYGLWVGWSYTAISASVAQADWYWWNTEQWIYWQTGYYELATTSSGLSTSQLSARFSAGPNRRRITSNVQKRSSCPCSAPRMSKVPI